MIELNNIGLVLQGGGMRGVFTSGVLDAFMENEIKFPYVIGVSAGANNGSSYVTGQKGRSKRIYLEWSKDKRFCGWNNFIKERSYFGMDFLFDHLPNELEPFDYRAFYDSNTTFVTGVTNCKTGKSDYLKQKEHEPLLYMNKVMRASSSLPLISKIVKIGDEEYIDGGLSDAIPVKESIKDGNRYNVVIMTRDIKYRSKPASRLHPGKLLFLKYPRLITLHNCIHEIYNSTIDYILQLEKEEKVYVFYPKAEVNVNRMEKDMIRMELLYEEGYKQGIQQMNDLKRWLNKIEQKNKKVV